MKNRKGLREASWTLMQGLVLVADRTGTYEPLCVLLHGRPPELLLQDVWFSGCLDGTQLGVVSPLENVGP